MYRARFKEDRKYSEDDIDYKYLFKASTSGSKYWIKAYTTETDIKFGSYSLSTDSSGGGGEDIKLLKQNVLVSMIGAFIGGAIYKKIDVDTIGVSKDWLNLLTDLKKYSYLLKFPTGSAQRKFYYEILWSLSDNIRLSKNEITNFNSFFSIFFKKVDGVIADKGL